ncbi:MAG: efflux RND transporter permease subunit [Verrucomicrobiales bacterium]
MGSAGGLGPHRGGEILVRTEAKRYTSPDFGDITVVTRNDGSQVHLRDVAKIVDGFEEIDLESRFDGASTMLLKVYRVGNEDTLKVAADVKKFILEESAPALSPQREIGNLEG